MSLSDAKEAVLDEWAFNSEIGWVHVKVRAYWEKRVYDRLFQGMPDDHEVSPAEFLLGLGINLPEEVKVIRFGQLKGSDVVFYAWKGVGEFE